MFSLRKIKELKKYRFFQDYKWDENACKLFDKNNLIYGWNGSGKTTLCDFFKDLENGALSDDEASCVLMFEDSTSNQTKSITQTSLGSIPYVFKVFNQNYIQENISQDTVKHIFTVGKEQADKLAEAKKLRTFAVQQSAAVKKLSSEHTSLLQEVDRFKTTKAKTIKDAANYTNAFNKIGIMRHIRNWQRRKSCQKKIIKRLWQLYAHNCALSCPLTKQVSSSLRLKNTFVAFWCRHQLITLLHH